MNAFQNSSATRPHGGWRTVLAVSLLFAGLMNVKAGAQTGGSGIGAPIRLGPPDPKAKTPTEAPAKDDVAPLQAPPTAPRLGT